MYESYHPLAMVKSGPPEKYLIGEVRDYSDFYSWTGDFYTKVKAKVEKLLPRDERRNSPSLFVKGVVIVVMYYFSMYLYIKYNNIWGVIIFSFFGSQVGVNVMHDGNHGAYSTNKYLSWIAGASLEFTGSTSVVYKRSHNFGHHGCVNHLELDRSFDTTFPLFRLHKLQPKMCLHKYQHFYVWLIYGMINFGDLFGTFDELAWMSNFPTRRGYVSRSVYWMHAFIKTYWIMFDLIIPSYFHGFYHAFPYCSCIWCYSHTDMLFSLQLIIGQTKLPKSIIRLSEDKIGESFKLRTQATLLSVHRSGPIYAVVLTTRLSITCSPVMRILTSQLYQKSFKSVAKNMILDITLSNRSGALWQGITGT